MRLSVLFIAAIIAAGCLASPVRASLVFYSDRGSFNAANPGLAVEDFEEARLAAGAAQYIGGPLNSASNNSVFHPGDILSGISFDNYYFTSANPLVALGAGTLAGTSKMVGNGIADDALFIGFGPGVTSVGLDLFAASAPGISQQTNVTVTIYTYNGSINDTIDYWNVSLLPTAGGFFGVSSTLQITGLRIDTTDPYVEFADNVAFGRPVVTSAVPEPGSLVLAGIGGLGLLAGRRLRRRRRRLS